MSQNQYEMIVKALETMSFVDLETKFNLLFDSVCKFVQSIPVTMGYVLYYVCYLTFGICACLIFGLLMGTITWAALHIIRYTYRTVCKLSDWMGNSFEPKVDVPNNNI
jgi:hypothetical protein